MRFGLHLSISGGLEKAARAALDTGCETFQIFSSSPRSWQLAKLDEGVAQRFRTFCAEHKIAPLYLHTPYLVNLSSASRETRQRSWASVSYALEKASLLGAEFVITHTGNHMGQGTEQGMELLSEALRELLASSKDVAILLEGGTGSGTELGRSFQEMRELLDLLPEHGMRLGICLDTAHLWAMGYDLRSEQGVEAVFSDFSQEVDLKRLGLIHVNDTVKALGSHSDEHAVPGQGLIGIEGFRALVNLPALADRSFILEEAGGANGERKRNLELLRGLVERKRG